jgi:protein-S-isoprenylcysteine O-methyltransferase Ste14
MPEKSADKPGIRLIPPLIYLAALAAAFAADWLWPVAVLPAGMQYALGATLMLAGGAMALWAVGLFRRADTPFDVRRPASALVTEGPYRISRNPGYMGLIAFSLGIGVAADNAWVLATVAIATALLHRFVIVPEERHLEARFGDAYRTYRARVRRWL